MNSEYEFEKYVATKENVREILDEYGVAIIPSVLTEIESNNIVSGIWDYLEHITQKWQTPISRTNEKSWKEYYKLMPSHSMLLQFFGVGHAQVSWDVRQNENVADCFAKIWNCNKEDLLVSFDGLSFHLPPEKTNRGWNRGKTWFHCDQSFRNSDFSCVQGWVSGEEINDGDATLAILEGSHKYHKDKAKLIEKAPSKDWYLMAEDEQRFYCLDKKCPIKKIKCPKGSLVLWDSRSVHCGTEACRGRIKQNIRAVIYVCYMPRSMSNEKNLEKKRKAFEEGRSTKHNPCKVGLFSKLPRTYGNEIPEITPIEKPKVNSFGLRLAGFEEIEKIQNNEQYKWGKIIKIKSNLLKKINKNI